MNDRPDDDGLDAVRALLPGAELTLLDTLSEGDRSTVRRVRVGEPDGADHTVVVKQYLTDDEGWLRETAALETVPGALRVPRPVAVGGSPRVLVVEDLGDGASVADALLGDDPAAAEAAVVGWAEALAELHVVTRDSRAAFRAALDARSDGAEISECRIPTGLGDAQRVLDRDCGSLGVALPRGALDELTGLATRLGGDAAATALTPADTCPDNNLDVGGRRVLIDFEGAEWRHVAWDVAYLQVPWPTCWCSWQMPEDVSRRAGEAYRRAAASRFPQVDDDAFDRDVEAAVVGWAVMTATWYLDHALGTELDSDPVLNPAKPTPTRRAMVLHRLGRAARSPELPALAELSGELHDVLHHRWGDTPLAYAPAFRGADG